MAKWARGLGEGVASVGKTLLDDSLLRMRDERIAQLQADRDAKQEAGADRRHKETIGLQREDIASRERIAKIKSDPSLSETQVVLTQEIEVVDDKGKPVYVTDENGNRVPKTMKMDVLFDRRTNKPVAMAPSTGEAPTSGASVLPEYLQKPGLLSPSATAPPPPRAASAAAPNAAAPATPVASATPAVMTEDERRRALLAAEGGAADRRLKEMFTSKPNPYTPRGLMAR